MGHGHGKPNQLGEVTVRDEGGYTLMEIMVVIAIIAMFVGAGGAFTLSNYPGDLFAAQVRVQALVAEANALASVTAGPDNTGTTLGFTMDPTTGDTVVTLYRYRPIKAATNQILVAVSDVLPVQTHTKIFLVNGDGTFAPPPFLVFMSSSGHVAAMAEDISAPFLAQEPPCPNNIVQLKFVEGDRSQTDFIDCIGGAMVLPTPH